MIELALPGARVAFTTREGGVSEGPYRSLNLGHLTADDPRRVAENRRLTADGFGVDPDAVATGLQVHGAQIAEWEGPPASPEADGRPANTPPLEVAGRLAPEVDGHVTSVVGVALLVVVADCLPVALAARGRVAMLHCGWRGLAAGILERALVSFEAPPAAAIGPGIGPCCYEVGPEVFDALAATRGAAGAVAAPAGANKIGAVAGRMLDLRSVAEARLRGAGVTRVEHVDLCTSCRGDLFFSHRRDGGVTGRQAGIAVRATR